MFPVRRYPAINPRLEAAARTRLVLAVVQGAEPEARTAALAALLDACGLARRTFPELGRRQLKARMKEIGEGQWASAAVRKAIQSMNSAVAASSAATAAASSASG